MDIETALIPMRERIFYICRNSSKPMNVLIQNAAIRILAKSSSDESTAWKNASAPCPAHETSGDMQPVRVEELNNKR
jgi:hypothetical protein